MKEIKVVCSKNGRAKVSTSDTHVSHENMASRFVLNFEDTLHPDAPKWCDIVLNDGTSLRYELGNDPIVNLDMSYDVTAPGAMTITPFIWDGSQKVKYKTDHQVIILEQKEAGDESAMTRDDYIFELRQRLEEIGLGTFEEIKSDLTPISTTGDTLLFNSATESDIVDRVFAIEIYKTPTHNTPDVVMINVKTELSSEDLSCFISGTLIGTGKLALVGCRVGYKTDGSTYGLYANLPKRQDFNRADFEDYADLSIGRIWRLRNE